MLPNSVGTTTFQYDPFGRRIAKTSAIATSIFVYDGSSLVETVNGTGSEIAGYVQDQGIDEPLAMQSNGAIDYYEQDGLGPLPHSRRRMAVWRRSTPTTRSGI